MQLLTHSRKDAFKTCRRKHWYGYELKLRRVDDARALRMGSAYHDGIAALGRGESVEEACAVVRSNYAHCPEQFDQYEWDIECETVMRLVCAYEWRWSAAPLENVAVERAFQLPLINPETGKRTPIFDWAGKIDGIVRLEDGRLAVKESKLFGDDISQDSSLWRRMRMDPQVSDYVHAARQLGHAVDTVLYDVARKPTIQPTAVPILDGDGLKIVLDLHGDRVLNAGNKSWRQTADKDKGYTLQSRPMTPEEWGEKLTKDICERPDYYFARVEIARMDADVMECQVEQWELQQAIREAQRTGRWYRTVSKQTCPWCEYFDLCSTSQTIDPAHPPVGFEILSNPHPELELTNGHTNRSTESPASPAAACEAGV